MCIRGHFDDNFCKILTKPNMMISNEQILVKSGFIRQAKHQRSSGLFENDSINKVQSVCCIGELGNQASKSVEYWSRLYPARLLSREVRGVKDVFSEQIYSFIYRKNVGSL